MTLLNVALDDVGSGSGFVGYAGYVGFSFDWERFTPDWRDLLQGRNLRALHTTDFLRANANARDFDPREIQAQHWRLLEPFASCIHKQEFFGVCVAVEHEGYDSLTATEKKRCGRPEELAFHVFANTIADWTSAVDPAAALTLMVDEGSTNDARSLAIYKRLKKIDPPLGRRIVSLSFGDDSAYPAIQAADLLANCFLKSLRANGDNLAFDMLTRKALPISERGHAQFVLEKEDLQRLAQRRETDPDYLPTI